MDVLKPLVCILKKALAWLDEALFKGPEEDSLRAATQTATQAWRKLLADPSEKLSAEEEDFLDRIMAFPYSQGSRRVVQQLSDEEIERGCAILWPDPDDQQSFTRFLRALKAEGREEVIEENG